MPRKAQIWSMDFMSSLIIFFMALIAIMFAWNYIAYQSVASHELKQLQMKVFTISDSLMRSPGLPGNWDQTNVRVIGLADEEGVINPTKAQFLVAMDYNVTKALLGIGLYDYYFEIADLNGTVYLNTTKPIVNSTFVVPMERYVIYGGRISKLKFFVWG